MPQLTIHTDGGARGNPGPAATGIVVHDHQGRQLAAFGTFLGHTTNNVAEYSAVKEALVWVVAHYPLPFPQLSFLLDSNLVVQQLNRQFQIKEPRLMGYAGEIWQLLKKNGIIATFNYVPRTQNRAADAVVNQVLDGAVASLMSS